MSYPPIHILQHHINAVKRIRKAAQFASMIYKSNYNVSRLGCVDYPKYFWL